MLIVTAILVIIILSLIMYNIAVYKKIDKYSNLNQQVTSLSVLQDFMNTISESSSADEKLEKINEILLNKYGIKYSTIVVYDGAQYIIKASNVDQRHWDTLKNLQSEPVFKDSIETATPKYITVDSENERLPYQKMELGRARCAMFFPLYVDNVYIGYWIIEGSMPHEFDNVDNTILQVVRNNIVTILKTIEKQQTLENIVRDDLFSGLKSEEYLYGEAKKTIDQYVTSAVCLFKVTNLPKINESISRKTGDLVITKISQFVKSNLAPEYIFVRYMGPKFAIVFSGADTQGVVNFMTDMKKKIEQIKVEAQKDYTPKQTKKEEQEKPVLVSPVINVVISTYYKGTALDGVTKKLEEYLDNNDGNKITIL